MFLRYFERQELRLLSKPFYSYTGKITAGKMSCPPKFELKRHDEVIIGPLCRSSPSLTPDDEIDEMSTHHGMLGFLFLVAFSYGHPEDMIHLRASYESLYVLLEERHLTGRRKKAHERSTPILQK